MTGFMDAEGAVVQPAPEDHPKDVFVKVVGDDISMRFALSEAQAEAMQDQLNDATAGFEVSR